MAKVCSNCGAQIQDGVKFCGKCGQKVPVETSEPKVCPNCGAPIQDGVKFCGKCGQKIQVKQTTAPQQRQDTEPQQRQDTEPQQRQDTEPPQRQDSAPQQRQDTEPPQQNQISADEAKENIKNFFSGGFQSAVEKFSALSLKNKAICVVVVVIALSMLFGGNSKTNKPEVQGKYLGMDVQTFVEDYNASLNSEWIKKLSGDASVNRDALKIIGTEQKSNGHINFKLNGAPIRAFNCHIADGYLAHIHLLTSSSDNPAAFVVAVNNVFLVMQNHGKLNFERVNGELYNHFNDSFKIKDSGVNIGYWNNPIVGYNISLGDENYKFPSESGR